MYKAGNPVKIMIVDDHPVVLEGMRALLQDEQTVDLQGTCMNGQETLSALRLTEVDVLLLDINLPDINGIDLCKQVKQLYPQIQVIAVSNYDERSMITKMLQSGATGYVLKNASAQEFVEAIETVIQRKLYLSSGVQQSLFDQVDHYLEELPKLTRREKEVLRCISQGKTTNEIADELFISPFTVETHRRNLMRKFEVSNAAALISASSRVGLL